MSTLQLQPSGPDLTGNLLHDWLNENKQRKQSRTRELTFVATALAVSLLSACGLHFASSAAVADNQKVNAELKALTAELQAISPSGLKDDDVELLKGVPAKLSTRNDRSMSMLLSTLSSVRGQMTLDQLQLDSSERELKIVGSAIVGSLPTMRSYLDEVQAKNAGAEALMTEVSQSVMPTEKSLVVRFEIKSSGSAKKVSQ